MTTRITAKWWSWPGFTEGKDRAHDDICFRYPYDTQFDTPDLKRITSA